MADQSTPDISSTVNSLRRDLGLWGAVVTGLGSIVGTGVFVSIGIAAGIAGPAVIAAIAIAAADDTLLQQWRAWIEPSVAER